MEDGELMKEVYKVWCEYDIDQDYNVFVDEKSAFKFIEEQCLSSGLDYQEISEQGLVGVESIALVSYKQ